MKRAALLLLAAPLLLAACGSKQESAQKSSAGGRENGKIIYSISQGEDPVFENCPGLWTVNPDGTDLVLIGPDDTFYPALSPDGRKVAALIEEDLWVIDLTNGAIRRLVPSLTPSSIYFFPYFTWAGSDALLVSRSVRGHDEIARIEVASGKARTLVKAGKEELAHPTASPDGSLIAYTHFAKRGAAVWVMGADGGNPHKLLEKAHSPVWTPDGKRITLFRSESLFEESALVSVDVKGDDERKLTSAFDGGPSSIRWSPDGGTLLFLREAQKPITPYGEQDVYRLEPSGGEESLVASNANLAGWAPAGDRILYTKQLPGGGANTRIGIYTSAPDGDDERLLAVQDDEDVNVHSDPVWQPDAGKLVPPKALADSPGIKKCVGALEKAREHVAR